MATSTCQICKSHAYKRNIDNNNQLAKYVKCSINKKQLIKYMMLTTKRKEKKKLEHIHQLAMHICAHVYCKASYSTG